MTNRQKLSLLGAALMTAFAAGRFSTPVKIKTEIKTVEVEKKSDEDKKNLDTHKETVVTETSKPDGTKQVVTQTTEDVKERTDDTTKADTQTATDSTKLQERSSQPVTLSALGGISLGTGVPTFGGSVTKPILGPVTMGLWALSNGNAGVSVGLTF